MTRSELFIQGNELLHPKNEFNRAIFFAKWSVDVLPLLGFKNLKVKFGNVTTDNKGWPLFGIKSLVRNEKMLSETELEFTFKIGPLVNLQDCEVLFSNDGNTQDQELLAFWIKVLYRSLASFKADSWGSILIEKEGFHIGL